MTTRPPESRREAARALVLAHGWNSVAYQILNPGIGHWFSRKGDAVVGYVSHAGVRVAAGAPVCEAGRLAEVIAEFEADAAANGQAVCFFCAGERVRAALAGDPGHSMMVLGAQPAWRPADWAGIVAGHPSLRAQLRRAAHKGVAVEEWPAARAEADAGLRECLSLWLAGRGLPPMGFLVEPWTLDDLADRRVFVARRCGETVGFAVASPVPGRRGWLAEQFVRRPDAPNGTVEAMLDAAVRAVAADGAGYFTLGLSPLSGHVPGPAVAEAGHPFWLRLLMAWARAHGTRFYNFAGLDTFKAKFRPREWEPVYAVTNEPAVSLRTCWAIGAAFTRGRPVRSVASALVSAARQEMTALLGAGRLSPVRPSG